MREAMARARVGDDVYGEDPTVNELEQEAAARVGKEAALFVGSGTMGNLVAILTHAGRGDEAIVGQDAHIFCWEAGAMATLGGIVPRPLPTDSQGRISMAMLESAVRGDDPHWPRSRLILLENSYGSKHGYPIAPDYFAAVSELARRRQLAVHLDGARLFNAAVALGIAARDITRHVDSVSFCLSKGLCAPVGSLLCGSAGFIHQARRWRKALGGGARQAGVLAAAGLVSVRQMIDRLADDHDRAQKLARGLAQIPGIVIDPEMVKTNLVFFGLADDVPHSTADVIDALRDRADIWLGDSGPRGFRAATHYWIDDTAVEKFLDTLAAIMDT
jgi:threonine aldolase